MKSGGLSSLGIEAEKGLLPKSSIGPEASPKGLVGATDAPGVGCRLASHSSRNDDPGLAGAGAAGEVGAAKDGPEVGAGNPLEPKLEYGGELHGERVFVGAPKAGLGGSSVFIRSKISCSTIALGRPYLAPESCFNASASFSFGLPKGGSVAILNGCVGTPPTSVRITVL